jgi:Leucine-rich repeat (LRR) protein
MTIDQPTLSRAVLRRMVAVLDAQTNGFVALVRLAGLDPARDFRGAVLDGVDFGRDDLSGFDFSGADLSGAILTLATGLDRIISDENTRFPMVHRKIPPDFDLARVHSMILMGTAPPEEWRPFITELSFVGETVSDLSPLTGLTALQNLDLRKTAANDLSPLAGLNSLQTLDLLDTQVSDVSPLANLTSLKDLSLFGTQVRDISPLSGLQALESLNLVGTEVREVAPLAALSCLRTLYVSAKVSDLRPLEASLSSLQALFVVEALGDRDAENGGLSLLSDLTYRRQ